MTRPDADLLVVGGGPVGLAAAVEAALRGMSVVVFEPRRSPVDKACGEGLMPGAVAALARLGVQPGGRRLDGIAYLAADGSSRAAHPFRAGAGLGVRRTSLVTALGARAEALGVPVVADRVLGLVQDGAGARVDLATGGRWHGRWVLGCDGLRSRTRALAGIASRTDGRRFGLRRHALVRPWSRHVEVHWSPGGEAYVTPVSADSVGVAVLTSQPAGFEALLRSFPLLQARLDGVEWLSEARGAGPLHRHVERRTSGRVLLAGDAAGYVDALTGEGLRIGFESARAAVDAVQRADPAGYERRWREITRTYRLVTRALLGLGGSPLTRAAVAPGAAVLPGVFGLAVDALAGGRATIGRMPRGVPVVPPPRDREGGRDWGGRLSIDDSGRDDGNGRCEDGALGDGLDEKLLTGDDR